MKPRQGRRQLRPKTGPDRRYPSGGSGPGHIAMPRVVSNSPSTLALGRPSQAKILKMTERETPEATFRLRVECPVWVMAWRRLAASVAAYRSASSSVITMLSLLGIASGCRNRVSWFTVDSGPSTRSTVENLFVPLQAEITISKAPPCLESLSWEAV